MYFRYVLAPGGIHRNEIMMYGDTGLPKEGFGKVILSRNQRHYPF